MPCRSGSSVAVATARPRSAVLGSLTAAAAANTLPALAPLAPPLARALRIPRTLGGDGVALTFDDGPHPEGTVAVLEGLREAAAPAAFFLIGEQVRSNPSLAAEIVAAGHAVELHGDRHRNQLRLTPAQMLEDMRRGAAAIEDASGRAPRFYRPPYGIFSAAGLWTVNRTSWRPLLWSRWGHDWRGTASAASIAAEASRDLGPGDVVLLHDSDAYSAPGSWVNTAEALPAILERIEGGGLSPVGLA
jgi:peptidoglycan/xylan/chitin deacetylase (PgdA/CDA1 family)